MDHDSARPQQSISEAAAQRLLARAAELDATLGAAVPIERLRLAAQEAGLSAASFDAALAELQEARNAPALRVDESWPSLARYAAAIVAAGAMVVGGALVFNDASSAWLVRKLVDPVALGLGAAVAMRFRARPLALVLGGLAIATGAEFILDTWTGQPAIRGSAPHFALMIAGIVGVVLGSLFRKVPRGGDSQGEAAAEPRRDRVTVPSPSVTPSVIAA